MNLNRIKFLCPVCKIGDIDFDNGGAFCSDIECKKEFPIINKKPVLIDFEKSVIKKESFIQSMGKSEVTRIENRVFTLIKRFLFGSGGVTKKNLKYISGKIHEIKNPKILIVGGGSIGSGMTHFYKEFSENILAFDIYTNSKLDFVADAHDIPVRDNTFDLIIVQAVLEHVIDPRAVVDQCNRVLKTNGLIYAETPFMQQVHEGAYDFTRFTDSGHRFLFKNFTLLKSGTIGGVGTTLMWSISYFFGSLFRSATVRKIFRVLFFWLRFFDTLILEKHNFDGASGVFFIGEKSEEILSEKDIILYYNGAQ